MGAWVREGGGGPWERQEPTAPEIQLDVTENPVVGVLLGPDGEVLRQVRERPPIGYRRAG